MKHFFSIVIYHDYDKLDTLTKGISNDLSIVPANSSAMFIRNNQLLLKSQSGELICYIEDDEMLKRETDMLFFWVVCTNESFYRYTEYPKHINFSEPYYYWSNLDESKSLVLSELNDFGQGIPPRQAIGCIGVSIKDIEIFEKLEFNVNFKTRKTFWQYHIKLNQNNDNFGYEIIDIKNEWYFKQIQKNEESIIFESKEPIEFVKKVVSRLKLNWINSQGNETANMILPFPNFSYKKINADGKEVTPTYIHI